MFVINFKAYVWGRKALELAKEIESVSKEVYVAVQPVDIRMISEETELKVLAQHVDPIEKGARTGWIIPESVKEAGAVGSLVNHSERPLKMEEIGKIVERLRELDMISIVCVPNLEKLKKVLEFEPDYIAYEPPELIGGDISVSKAKPDIIKEAVKECGKIPLLVGAGIKKREDVEIAYKLGARGILVASGIVKAENPREKVKELLVEYW